MKDILYHCAQIILGPGSIILPGNWGRIKQQFEENGATIAREVIIENIRIKEFLSKPSRFDGVFACPTIDSAKLYRDKHAPTNLIYEIEILDPTAARHDGDYETCIKGFVGINSMQQNARTYWNGTNNNNAPEILTLSPIKIIRQLE